MQRRDWHLGLFMGLCLLWATPAAAQRLRIEVGGPDFRPYPVAVPELAVLGAGAKQILPAAQQLTALLQADVDLARSLVLVPPKTYLAVDRAPQDAPNYPNWLNVGASGLVRGSVEGDARALRVVLRFFDVTGQKELLSRTCSEPVEQSSRCVHRFLDALVSLLTGEPGIFSSRIAYVKRTVRKKQVFACDLDGGHPELLTDNDSLNLLPTWEPSGQALLLTSYINGNADLYRLPLSGRNALTPVSRQRGLNTGASVSPDGKRIALTLSIDGNTEIYTIDSNGKNLKRLTDSWGQDVSPTWSPDGSRIAFVSSRSGQPHIYVMQSDGSRPAASHLQGHLQPGAALVAAGRRPDRLYGAGRAVHVRPVSDASGYRRDHPSDSGQRAQHQSGLCPGWAPSGVHLQPRLGEGRGTAVDHRHRWQQPAAPAAAPGRVRVAQLGAAAGHPLGVAAAVATFRSAGPE